MYIADVEGSAVSGKTSGAESRYTALVSKLCQRVVLIHELRQRRRAEKLTNSRNNGTDIYEVLGSQALVVLNVHALFYDLVHSGKTDTQLVLQKLAYASQTAVAKVVDVVCCADVMRQAEKVVDGRENIRGGDVSRAEIVNALFGDIFDLVQISSRFLHDLAENAVLHLFGGSDIGKIISDNVSGVNRAVGEHLDLVGVFETQVNGVNAGVLDSHGVVTGEVMSFVKEDLAGACVRNGTGKVKARDTRAEGELFVVLVSAFVPIVSPPKTSC